MKVLANGKHVYPLLLTLPPRGLLGIAFSAYPVKRKYCEKPEKHPSHNIDGVMKHAVDRGNRQEQTSQPVKDFHPFKMGAPPPCNEKRSGNVGTWKGCARIFSLCVNKIH